MSNEIGMVGEAGGVVILDKNYQLSPLDTIDSIVDLVAADRGVVTTFIYVKPTTRYTLHHSPDNLFDFVDIRVTCDKLIEETVRAGKLDSETFEQLTTQIGTFAPELLSSRKGTSDNERLNQFYTLLCSRFLIKSNIEPKQLHGAFHTFASAHTSARSGYTVPIALDEFESRFATFNRKLTDELVVLKQKVNDQLQRVSKLLAIDSKTVTVSEFAGDNQSVVVFTVKTDRDLLDVFAAAQCGNGRTDFKILSYHSPATAQHFFKVATLMTTVPEEYTTTAAIAEENSGAALLLLQLDIGRSTAVAVDKQLLDKVTLRPTTADSSSGFTISFTNVSLTTSTAVDPNLTALTNIIERLGPDLPSVASVYSTKRVINIGGQIAVPRLKLFGGELLAHVTLTDPIVNKFLHIRETTRVYSTPYESEGVSGAGRTQRNVKFAFRELGADKSDSDIRFSLSIHKCIASDYQALRPSGVATVGVDYLRINIERAESIASVARLRLAVSKLLSLYIQRYSTIAAEYKKVFGVGCFDGVKLTTPAVTAKEQESATATMKKLVKLKAVDPTRYNVREYPNDKYNYSVKCQGDKQPVVVTDVSGLEAGTFAKMKQLRQKKDKTGYVEKEDTEEDSNPYHIACTDKRYKYVNFQKATSDGIQDPCCVEALPKATKKKTTAAPDQPQQLDAADDIAFSRKSGAYVTIKIAYEGFTGVVPKNVYRAMKQCVGYNIPDFVVNRDGVSISRERSQLSYGINNRGEPIRVDDRHSLLNCIRKALFGQPPPKTNEERDTMITGLLAKIELSQFIQSSATIGGIATVDEIKAEFTNGPIDSRRHLSLLEKLFNVRIVVFDQNANGELDIPSFQQAWLRDFNQYTDVIGTMFVYRNEGSSAELVEYPIYELLIYGTAPVAGESPKKYLPMVYNTTAVNGSTRVQINEYLTLKIAAVSELAGNYTSERVKSYTERFMARMPDPNERIIDHVKVTGLVTKLYNDCYSYLVAGRPLDNGLGVRNACVPNETVSKSGVYNTSNRNNAFKDTISHELYDHYGKCRGVVFKPYGDKTNAGADTVPITLHLSPLPPGLFMCGATGQAPPVAQTPPPPSFARAQEFVVRNGLVSQVDIVNGMVHGICVSLPYVHRAYIATAPITDSQIPAKLVENAGTLLSDNYTNNGNGNGGGVVAKTLHSMRTAELIKQLVAFHYSTITLGGAELVSVHDQLDSPNAIDQYFRNHTVVDPQHHYELDRVQRKITLNSDVFFKDDRKLIFRSTRMRDALRNYLGVLVHNGSGLFARLLRSERYENFYLTVDDFNSNGGGGGAGNNKSTTNVFTSMRALENWMQYTSDEMAGGNLDATNSRFTPRNVVAKSAYFIKNWSLRASSRPVLVQPANSLEHAIAIGEKFIESGIVDRNVAEVESSNRSHLLTKWDGSIFVTKLGSESESATAELIPSIDTDPNVPVVLLHLGEFAAVCRA